MQKYLLPFLYPLFGVLFCAIQVAHVNALAKAGFDELYSFGIERANGKDTKGDGTVAEVNHVQNIFSLEKGPLDGLFELSDTLILTQHNDNCGEWGGDIEIIRIFVKRQGFEIKGLFGYFQRIAYNCDTLVRNPYGTLPSVYVWKQQQLSNEMAKVAEACIIDLIRQKLTNTEIAGHAGILNRVELKGSIAFVKDPSLFIEDYGTFQWEMFHQLKAALIR